MYTKTRFFLALLSLITVIGYNFLLKQPTHHTAAIVVWGVSVATDTLLVWFTYKAWKFSKKK